MPVLVVGGGCLSNTLGQRYAVPLPHPRSGGGLGRRLRIVGVIEAFENAPGLAAGLDQVAHEVGGGADAAAALHAQAGGGDDLRNDTEILSGLSEGQQVVASGQFLIDSEASLKSVLPKLAGNAMPDVSMPAPPTAGTAAPAIAGIPPATADGRRTGQPPRWGWTRPR